MLAPMCICMLSHVPLYGTLWTTYSLPGSWSMGFSWQEYWSILQFPPPGTYVYNHCKYDIYMNIHYYFSNEETEDQKVDNWPK